MRRLATSHRDDLTRLEARISEEAGGEPITVRILEGEGVPLYVLAKHSAGAADRLAAVIARIGPEVPTGWTIHLNGNNAALLPPFLGKHHAVEWLLPELRRLHPEAMVIGIGDSLSDAAFMSRCDFAMMPTRSQLANVALSGRSVHD